MTSCDPSSLCVTLLCSQAKIDVCRPYNLTLIFGPGNESFRVQKSQRAKVPGSESSTYGTKVPVTKSL